MMEMLAAGCLNNGWQRRTAVSCTIGNSAKNSKGQQTRNFLKMF